MKKTKDALEMMRAINELTQGFQEVAPLLYEVLEKMMGAVSNENAFGYMQAMDKIDRATVDQKDVLLLMMTQWVATVLNEARSDGLLEDILEELFPDSKMLRIVPGCKIVKL